MFADPFFLLGAAKTGQQDVGLHLLQRLPDVCHFLRLFFKSHAGRERTHHHQPRVTGLDILCGLVGCVFFSAQHKDRAALFCRTFQQRRHEVRAGYLHFQRPAIQLCKPDERLPVHQRQVGVVRYFSQHGVLFHLHHDVNIHFHHIGRSLLPYLLQQKLHRLFQRDIVDVGVQQLCFFHRSFSLYRLI